MKFNSVSIFLFVIILFINIICSYGLTIDDERNIEAVVNVFFKGASESCKNEYRQIQTLLVENDDKKIQDYLKTYKATTCKINTPAFDEISRELYNIYRNYPKDKNGNDCNEMEIQNDFDKLGICRNECYTKVANFLYIYRYQFKGSRLHRNQMKLMERCGNFTRLKQNIE